MNRHQQRRGKKLPEGVKSVARPSRWGNPYKVGHVLSGTVAPRLGSDLNAEPVLTVVGDALAVALFRHYASEQLDGWLDPLREAAGLACYCALDASCHADVLIELLLEEGASSEG